MNTGRESLTAFAAHLNTFFSGLLERLFGPGVRQIVFGGVTWADLGILGCFILLAVVAHSLIAFFVRRKILRIHAEPSSWQYRLLTGFSKPLYLLIWIYGIYFAVTLLTPDLLPGAATTDAQQVFDRILDFALVILVCWLFLRLTRALEARLAQWATKSKSKLDDILVPLIGKSLRILVPVIAIILMLPVIGLPAAYNGLIAKASSLLIIGAISWILFGTVDAVEKFTLSKYDITVADNLQARKVYTQVKVITKTIYFIIGIISLASALMIFEEVRRVGTSILASAGVVGVILGFAAQKTIANLFAGFQLAMAQPIRLDDVVIVESEWGRVEEITLTYVVVHIWDDRRLIVPLSYFIEKPFQNWTRVSASLLGSVFLWVDFTMPVAELRRGVQEIVDGCKDWDRRYWNLQITDSNERAMQVRVLATAADSGKAWDLRCEIREKLIALVQSRHALSLPRLRADLKSVDNPDASSTGLPAKQLNR